MMLWSISSITIILLGMGAVAFITLLERKLIGLSQTRLGPNKMSFLGVLQPMLDGIKLLSKQFIQLSVMQFMLLIFMPCLLMSVFMMSWLSVLPWLGALSMFKYDSLILFILLGMGAYAVILTGWSSTSLFSKMGSLRGMLQSISYEVTLVVIIIFILFFLSSLSISSVIVLSLELSLIWTIIWVVVSLMESNRAPFDLLEGESELISGFNIEMGSLSFVYLFLSEYGMILILSGITETVIVGYMMGLTMVVVIIMLLMRSCFPRIRYDSLMMSMWQSILPLMILLSTLSGIKP